MEKRVPGIIIALDEMGEAAALEFAGKFSPEDGVLFKVNDLLDEPGPQIIPALAKFGADIMSDPKYFDIPNTVKNRVRKMAKLGPKFITVHGAGEVKMIRHAVEARGSSMILVVTVLTSLGEEECNLSLGGPVKAQVLNYARYAILGGAQGLVCSGMELAFLGDYQETHSLIKVIPAIRPAWSLGPKDDQKRVTTAAEVARLGADYIVVGRPITQAKDPVEALKKTRQEMVEAIGA